MQFIFIQKWTKLRQKLISLVLVSNTLIAIFDLMDWQHGSEGHVTAHFKGYNIVTYTHIRDLTMIRCHQ